jgi:hypothetical protein
LSHDPPTPRLTATRGCKGHKNMQEAWASFKHEKSIVHHRLLSYEQNCSNIRDEEQNTFDEKNDKFSHYWIKDSGLSFCDVTKCWWLVYVEGQGMFCLLCRQNDEHNVQNKAKAFNKNPSVRSKKSAVDEHRKSAQHNGVMQKEMVMRVSVVHKEKEERRG